MDNTKDDIYYVSKLHEDMVFIVKQTKNISVEELADNEVLLDSMMFRLIRNCLR